MNKYKAVSEFIRSNRSALDIKVDYGFSGVTFEADKESENRYEVVLKGWTSPVKVIVSESTKVTGFYDGEFHGFIITNAGAELLIVAKN